VPQAQRRHGKFTSRARFPVEICSYLINASFNQRFGNRGSAREWFFEGRLAMHIVLAVLAAVAGIGFWIWRAHMAARAASDLLETADDIRAAVRRFGYRRKANVNPLDGIEDARLAAAGILAAFASMDGALSREEIAAIAGECGAAFSAEAQEAEQITAYGRWLIQQSANMDEVVRRLGRSLETRLDAAEKRQLLAMIERVGGIEGGGLSDSQRYALDSLARQLG
jgi:uncharacterized tellurite resistance protein B-like protein